MKQSARALNDNKAAMLATRIFYNVQIASPPDMIRNCLIIKIQS